MDRVVQDHPSRRAHAAAHARLHARHHLHPGRRHRRQHRDVLGGQRRPAAGRCRSRTPIASSISTRSRSATAVAARSRRRTSSTGAAQADSFDVDERLCRPQHERRDQRRRARAAARRVHLDRRSSTSWASSPLLGRAFLPSEAEPGRAGSVVLGYGLWQRRFGGAPTVIGQSIRINGEPYTVVGVMPASVTFPQRAELWMPSPHDLPPLGGGDPRENRGMHYLRGVARLKPGVSLATANAELDDHRRATGARLSRHQLQLHAAGDPAPGRAGAFGAHPAHGAARRRALRAADRHRQRRQPADGAGHGAGPRAGDSGRARRRPPRPGAPAAHRGGSARRGRRRVRRPAGLLGRGSDPGARAGRDSARRADRGRPARRWPLPPGSR